MARSSPSKEKRQSIVTLRNKVQSISLTIKHYDESGNHQEELPVSESAS